MAIPCVSRHNEVKCNVTSICRFRHTRVGCNFSKSMGGAQRVKSVQSIIKILMKFDFCSDLTHFLTIIGGGGSAMIGGGSGTPKEI